MARSPNGQAISATRRTRPARRRLTAFLQKSKKRGNLSAWRRGKAVLGYIQGKKVIAMAAELDVTRGSSLRDHQPQRRRLYVLVLPCLQWTYHSEGVKMALGPGGRFFHLKPDPLNTQTLLRTYSPVP